MSEKAPLYAAIDLGSNSFHMLIVRYVSESPQVIARIKRKVRLAAGLDERNQLSLEAMQRGWQCLTLFAERLQDIPRENIRVVATATLRIATNAQDFITEAQKRLGADIQIIRGEEEARLIYNGVAHTTGGSEDRLVVDIGGASTELVIGHGMQPQCLASLSMGCVTWLESYFKNRLLSEENFTLAEQAARHVLQPYLDELLRYPWQICVGASGTVQALQEIMIAQGMDELITLDKLQHLKQQAIQCGKVDDLVIDGLTLERALVFPSGLSILIAIFSELKITGMTLAGGALREGLIYGMLHLPEEANIRQRTIRLLQKRYQLDDTQAERVSRFARTLFEWVETEWRLTPHAGELLFWACQIHEIGLSVDFRQAPQHAAYLIKHTELPGFTLAQKQLLAALLLNQTNAIDLPALQQQNALPIPMAYSLCRLLRITLLLACRRRDDTLPEVKVLTHGEEMTLMVPQGWLARHPLRAEQLEQECRWQRYVQWPLRIVEET